jgi:hypothetical protein
MRRWIVAAALLGGASLASGCDREVRPTPAISGTWIDAPEDGSTIVLQPYTLEFHGASVMGMDEFELSINGQPEASVPPAQTGPGGSQGTLFMGEYDWDPPATGTFEIEVRAKDQAGLYGPTAHAQVVVVEDYTALAPEAVQLEPHPTAIPVLPVIPILPSPTATSAPPEFGPPTYSTREVYYRGLGCGPKSVDVQIPVADPSAYSVVLFVRLMEPDSGERTEWLAIAMDPLGNSSFGHELVVEKEIPDAFRFPASELQVQIVASARDGSEIGRTPVGSEVRVMRCSS